MSIEHSVLYRNCRTIGMALAMSVSALSLFSSADTAKFDLDIKSQNIGSALVKLGEKAGVQIMLAQTLGDSIQLGSIKGSYTLAEALDKMLSGSGLGYEFASEGEVVIRKLATDTDKSGREPSGKERHRLEEIIVTASKKDKGVSIQDTAMAISALSSETIDKRGLVGMDDYLRTLPGVDMQDRGAGKNTVIVRGLASDPQLESSTVGIYFGETPLTGLTPPGFSDSAGSVDIKLVDIERIEVLRGPQGTLYGSGSMGGTVRVLPASPNLNEVEGSVSARYSQTSGLGSGNSMVQGVINVPLIEDELAVRAVAYKFENSGFIENVAASQPNNELLSAIAQGGVAQDRGDVGNDQYTGFRVTALWQPTEELDVTLSYIQQKIEQDGLPEVSMKLDGNFQQIRLRTGFEGANYDGLKDDVDITNLTVNYDFGWANITSSSSWTNYNGFFEGDESVYYGSPWYAKYDNLNIKTFVEELRLTSNFEGPLQFLVGLYYEDQDKVVDVSIPWSGSADLDVGPFILNYLGGSTEQKAVFAEVSYDITDKLTATLGTRYSEYEQSNFQTASIFGTTVIDNKDLRNSADDQIYKASLTYTPNDDILVYGQWTQGFRLGKRVDSAYLKNFCDDNQDGLLDDLGVPIPDKVDSDSADNYELGIKTSLADNRITLNTAIYHINWQGMPVVFGLPSCATAVTLNAGESESEGIEVEMQAQLTDSWLLDLSASYNDSVLTKDAPNIGGKTGDNLPGSADYNFSAGLEYQFTVAGFDAFARSDYSYIGEYYNNLSETGQAAGGFSQLHLRAGVNLNNVYMDIFIQNLTDADDFTWVESLLSNTVGTARAYRLRPRTMGFNIGYRF